MQHRPNILFLMSDEHRFDTAGFAGNQVVRTPNLDNLAAGGIRFDNAYTPSPVCIPARQCLMSGQLPKTCGCEGWIDLAPGYRTFASDFSRHAYNTVACGKLHHIGKDMLQGWTKRINPDADLAQEHIDGLLADEVRRYTPAPGTGKWSNQREVEEARPGDGPYQSFDRQTITGTLVFLEHYFRDHMYNRPQAHRPLLLKVSLKQPHYPFFCPEELFSYYLDRVPFFHERPCDHPVLSQSQCCHPVDVSPALIRRATAAYYSMIETVDSHLGAILGQLAEVGQDLDDWIVVYTSDHGDMMGQHGIWEKTRFYEGSVRVPLLVRYPRRFQGGSTVTANVSLCDLYATLCDLAGLPIPEGLDSRSTVGLMSGSEAGWDNEVVSQFERTHVMIKRNALKYQYYGSHGPEVLFDLARDPGETTDVSLQPGYAEMMRGFRARLARLGHGPEAELNYRNAGYRSRTADHAQG